LAPGELDGLPPNICDLVLGLFDFADGTVKRAESQPMPDFMRLVLKDDAENVRFAAKLIPALIKSRDSEKKHAERNWDRAMQAEQERGEARRERDHLRHHDRRATDELDAADIEKYDDEPRADSTDGSEGSEWSLWKRISILRARAVQAEQASASKDAILAAIREWAEDAARKPYPLGYQAKHVLSLLSSDQQEGSGDD
jgi:hypothetical protein